ncbi:hypothetical protein, partial [Candidatus Chlorohelix sp.]|uniref:hypothetical protein n=1 Tax=Candidatus Chlorohelix sp. TaxID=3139201 RepID=UPI00306AE325
SNALSDVRRLVFEDWKASADWYEVGKLAQLQGARPVWGGTAVTLPPAPRSYALAGTPSENRYSACVYGNLNYFAIGNKLYKLTADANRNFTSFVDTGLTFAAGISDMCVHAGLLFIACVSSKTYSYDGTTLTDVTATYGGSFFVASYAGMLFWVSGGADVLNWRIPATGTNYSQNMGVILSLVPAGGSLWLGVEMGLSRLTGHLRAGNPSAAPGVLNLFEPEIAMVAPVSSFRPTTAAAEYNFYRMVAAHGYLWFPVNGRLYRMRFSDSLGMGQGIVEPQPLYGKSRGLAFCDGLVVWVCESGGWRYIWCWSPEVGWWLLDAGGLTTQNYGQPFCGFPTCRDAAICCTLQGEIRVTRWGLDSSYPSGRNPSSFGLSDVLATGYIRLPLLGLEACAKAGGENGREVAARITAIGVEWGLPGYLNNWFDPSPYVTGGASAGTIKFTPQFSTNAGATWSSLTAYAPLTGALFQNGKYRWSVDSTYGEAITEAGTQPGCYEIMLKLEGAHFPAVRRVWLEYRLERVQHASKREWKIKLALGAPDTTLNLGGQVGNTSGGWSSVAAALSAIRTLWSNGNTVDFYDLDGSGAYRVKVASFKAVRSSVAVPYEWEMALTLAEVQE